jgi:putative hydrolase of the HAD superfamily
MIRNIVLDMGNVMIRFDPAAFMTREGVTNPQDRILVMNELFLSVEWAQMDAGVLTEETAEPSILSRFPDRLKPHVRNLLYHWSVPGDGLPGMEDLIRRLKLSGYGIYLLSNASKAQHEYWPKIPASRLFDGKLISCDVGFVKPMKEIYEIFTSTFSLRPEECVFIDDAPCNVAGAIACGWQGIVFHGSCDELERKLRALRVSPAPSV